MNAYILELHATQGTGFTLAELEGQRDATKRFLGFYVENKLPLLKEQNTGRPWWLHSAPGEAL